MDGWLMLWYLVGELVGWMDVGWSFGLIVGFMDGQMASYVSG